MIWMSAHQNEWLLSLLHADAEPNSCSNGSVSTSAHPVAGTVVATSTNAGAGHAASTSIAAAAFASTGAHSTISASICPAVRTHGSLKHHGTASSGPAGAASSTDASFVHLCPSPGQPVGSSAPEDHHGFHPIGTSDHGYSMDVSDSTVHSADHCAHAAGSFSSGAINCIVHV